MGYTSLLQALEDRHLACAATLGGYTGGAGMCQIHKEGRVTGGLKYHEGRLVVLGEIIRQFKRMSPFDAGEAAMILKNEGEKWQAQLARHQFKEQPAISWVAYSQGGVDAVTEIEALLLSQE